MKKSGLGKGLESLFGIYNSNVMNNALEENDDVVEKKEKVVERSDKKTGETIQLIKTSMIDPNKNQPRKRFNEESLNDLANSIKTHGVIQPIIVCEKNGRFVIIAGERRWRACKLAEVKEIPCVVGKYTDSEIKEISIIENLQREDLTPIEEAKAIKELMSEFGWSQEVIAERLGKSRPAIANTIRLLQLQPEVIQMIEDGKLSAGHARSLVVITDKNAQLKLAKQVAERKLTVRDLEGAVKNVKSGKKADATVSQSPELKQLIVDMQRVFSTKVSVMGSDHRGRIYIDYYNKDDLERIFELIEKLK